MTPSFVANGTITLTTDFGLSDPYVGVMKAAILRHFAKAQLIDLTHAVPVFAPASAGFWLARSAPHFAAGTVHLAVVDPGVGTSRAMLLVEQGGQVFVAPDNGLLQPVLASPVHAVCRRFTWDSLQCLGLPQPSNTFHGRDVLAPLVAAVARGSLLPGAVGELIHQPAGTPSTPPRMGMVVWVDHYGNLLTDLPAASLSYFTNPVALVAKKLISFEKSYGYAEPGELLALVNSWGMIEIAQRDGSAQRALSGAIGMPVTLQECGSHSVTGQP